MKYLVMIRSGHVAMYRGRINKDVEPFIKYFLPKGTLLNMVTASHAVRHLHLAFKRMTADEIYDVFMELLLEAVKKYDPQYTEKVKIVAGKIDEVFRNASFSIAELNDHLEFDSNRFIRLLCRRGFLQGSGERERTPRSLNGEELDYGRRPPVSSRVGLLGSPFTFRPGFGMYAPEAVSGTPPAVMLKAS